jgi:hypothetical protein
VPTTSAVPAVRLTLASAKPVVLVGEVVTVNPVSGRLAAVTPIGIVYLTFCRTPNGGKLFHAGAAAAAGTVVASASPAVVPPRMAATAPTLARCPERRTLPNRLLSELMSFTSLPRCAGGCGPRLARRDTPPTTAPEILYGSTNLCIVNFDVRTVDGLS